jgi:hypothetical protein
MLGWGGGGGGKERVGKWEHSTMSSDLDPTQAKKTSMELDTNNTKLT